MIRLKEQGYSYASIGKLYSVTRQRVHQLISGYGKNQKRLSHKNGLYWRLHQATLVRDAYQCQVCGSKNNLVVHHLDSDDNNNLLPNLITLCNNCHLDLHRPTGWVTARNHNGKKNLTDNAKNPLEPLSGLQGRGIKRFFMELLGRIKR